MAENYWYMKFNLISDKYETESPNAKWSDVGSTNCSVLHTGFGVCENDGFHGDIEYFYEVVCEVIQDKIFSKTGKIYINVYEINHNDYSKPITRENLKLIKTVQVKNPKEQD